MDVRSFLLTIFCWALGTLMSAIHACLENTTGASLEQFADQRGRSRIVGARLSAIRSIIADIPGHEHAVALARILCNLGVAVASVFVIASLHRPALGPVSPNLYDAAIGVLLSAIVLWIFAVSVAESIGRHVPERFLYAFGPLARAAYLLQRPLTPFASAIDSIVRKIAGAEQVTKTEEVSEEIISVAEEGEREGLIDEDERRMIEAVVNFKRRTVEQIMTPRNEIEALEYTNNLGAITAFVRKVRHSRVPVYKAGGGLDNVIGFFYTKDLLRWLAGTGTPPPALRAGPDRDAPAHGEPKDHAGTVGVSTGFELKNILRPALHVPDSKTIRELADEFVTKKVHVAVVVDEYGALTGLVTLEDIIEDVFGDIQDEYEKTEDDPPRIDVRPEDDGRGGLADIDARAYIGDANQALEPLGAAIPESDDYDTVGGFVLSTLGHMPEVNESFSHGCMTFTVLEAAPTRVLRVRVQVKSDEPPRTAAEDRAK
jgi:CBS domain containing-hemolysin-like protein